MDTVAPRFPFALDRPEVTRFAPSPTGLLHLGHAYSAMVGAEVARQSGGRFLLRMEDIDHGRSRREFEDAIYEDLSWLGLTWEQPVRRQSAHMEDYRQALARLEEHELIYPCFCTRKDILAEIENAPSAPHGPAGLIYPGTCRDLARSEAERRVKAGWPFALRMNLDKALAITGALEWMDVETGITKAEPELLGDVVLARKDINTSYHLSVVVDDHIQGITLVTRGADLYHATHIHRVLQALLGYKSPRYFHHRLLRDPEGDRFSKRDRSVTLRAIRESGQTPEVIAAALFEDDLQTETV